MVNEKNLKVDWVVNNVRYVMLTSQRRRRTNPTSLTRPAWEGIIQYSWVSELLVILFQIKLQW